MTIITRTNALETVAHVNGKYYKRIKRITASEKILSFSDVQSKKFVFLITKRNKGWGAKKTAKFTPQTFLYKLIDDL